MHVWPIDDKAHNDPRPKMNLADYTAAAESMDMKLTHQTIEVGKTYKSQGGEIISIDRSEKRGDDSSYLD